MFAAIAEKRSTPEDVTRELLAQADEAARAGVEVDVRRYASA